MPESGINPMAIDDGSPYGGSGYGSPFGGPGATPQEPTGGGAALGPAVTGQDEYARRMGGRRRMMGMQRGGVMPEGGGQIDPQVVQMVMGHFLQMLKGGMGGQPMGQMGGMPVQAFAQGGIVNRPTVGILGEQGPEAVVPLGPQWGGQAGQPQGSWPRPPQTQMQAQPQGQITGFNTDLSRFNQQPQAPNPQSGYGAIPWYLGAARDAGFYGPNPPPAIMEGIRNRIIQDNAAQARSARLGLAGRSDVDPSTFGFQSLMSDLQGQQNLSRGLNDADLALRMQQLQFLQSLLKGEQGFGHAQVLGRENRNAQDGGFLGDLTNFFGGNVRRAAGGE